MHLINARNVAQALPLGVAYLREYGCKEPTRNGDVLVAPCPVTTIYSYPDERVLLSAARDANPFFHLAEALWMLAGRNDVGYLNKFIKSFGERFGEPNGTMHGAYGFRWREYFPMDQLKWLIDILKRDDTSRRAVLTMWDPIIDLGRGDVKDIPCNTHIYFRINQSKLDMTVCCRSNDMLWGAYGANAVHFSVLQEYLAAHLDLRIGTYYQISNNFHVYLEELNKHPGAMSDQRRYPTIPLVGHLASFDEEVTMLLDGQQPKHNLFLAETAYWMLEAYETRSVPRDAIECLQQVQSKDWRVAGQEWIARRSKA